MGRFNVGDPVPFNHLMELEAPLQHPSLVARASGKLEKSRREPNGDEHGQFCRPRHTGKPLSSDHHSLEVGERLLIPSD